MRLFVFLSISPSLHLSVSVSGYLSFVCLSVFLYVYPCVLSSICPSKYPYVHSSVCLSFYQSIYKCGLYISLCPSFFVHHRRTDELSIEPYLHLFNHLSFCQSVSLSVCQSVSLSVCQSVSLSVCQSVSLSVCQSVSLSVCQSVSPSVCQCVYLSVCLLVKRNSSNNNAFGQVKMWRHDPHHNDNKHNDTQTTLNITSKR
jgi:hypothetical protein